MATVKIQKKVGNNLLEATFEGEKTKELLFKAAPFLAEDVCKCGSVEIEYQSKRAKDFEFVYRKCKKCGHESQLGEFKGESKACFWKEWEASYKAKSDYEDNQLSPPRADN